MSKTTEITVASLVISMGWTITYKWGQKPEWDWLLLIFGEYIIVYSILLFWGVGEKYLDEGESE